MSKCNTSGSQPPHKRRKEGHGSVVDLDALIQRRDKVEDIRVWNVAVSETNGRVSASRKTRQHIYECPPELPREEPPASTSEEESKDRKGE